MVSKGIKVSSDFVLVQFFLQIKLQFLFILLHTLDVSFSLGIELLMGASVMGKQAKKQTRL